MTKRSPSTIIFSFAFLTSLCGTACTTSTDEEEPVGATTTELVSGSGPNGNITITADELRDPTTGCFVINPTCSLSPNAAGAAREVVVLSSDHCLRRASEWSLWCGNRQGAQTTAIFKIHNLPQRSTTFTAPNDTRCVVAVNSCQRYPMINGIFGDAFDGSDTNPARCATRAKDYHEWCGNAPGARISTRFDRAGVPGPLTLFP